MGLVFRIFRERRSSFGAVRRPVSRFAWEKVQISLGFRSFGGLSASQPLYREMRRRLARRKGEKARGWLVKLFNKGVKTRRQPYVFTGVCGRCASQPLYRNSGVLVIQEIREVGWQSTAVEECANRFGIRQAASVSE